MEEKEYEYKGKVYKESLLKQKWGDAVNDDFLSKKGFAPIIGSSISTPEKEYYYKGTTYKESVLKDKWGDKVNEDFLSKKGFTLNKSAAEVKTNKESKEDTILSLATTVDDSNNVDSKKKESSEVSSLKDSLLTAKSDAVAQNTINLEKEYITPEFQKAIDSNRIAAEEWHKFTAEKKKELEKDSWVAGNGFLNSAHNALVYAIPSSGYAAEASGTIQKTKELESKLEIYDKIVNGDIAVRGEFKGEDTKISSLYGVHLPDYGAYKKDKGDYPKTVGDVIKWQKDKIRNSKIKSISAMVTAMDLSEKLSYVETPADFTQGGDWWMDTKKALGSQLPQMAVSVLMPIVGSYLQEQGGIYLDNISLAAQKYYKKPLQDISNNELLAFMDSEEGNRIANESQVYGAASASLDLIGLAKLSSILKPGAKEVAKNTIKNKGTRLIGGMLTEASTELGQDELSSMSRASATGEAYNPNPDINTAITAMVTAGLVGSPSLLRANKPIQRVSENPETATNSDIDSVVETGDTEIDSEVLAKTKEINEVRAALDGLKGFTNTPSYSRNGEAITLSQALWRLDRGDIEGLSISNDVELENKLKNIAKEKVKNAEANNNKPGQSESSAGEILQDNVRAESDVEDPSGEINITREEEGSLKGFSTVDLRELLETSEASGDEASILAIKQELKSRGKPTDLKNGKESNFQKQSRLEQEAREKSLNETLKNKGKLYETQDAISEQIKNLESKLGNLDEDSDEYKKTVDDIGTLEVQLESLKKSERKAERDTSLTEDELKEFSLEEEKAKAAADLDLIESQGMQTEGYKRDRKDTGDETITDKYSLGFESFIHLVSSFSAQTRAWLGNTFIQPVDRIAGIKIANEAKVAEIIKKYIGKDNFNPHKVWAYSMLNRDNGTLKSRTNDVVRSLQNELTNAVSKGDAKSVKEITEKRKAILDVVDNYSKNKESLTESEMSFYKEAVDHLESKRNKWFSIVKQVFGKEFDKDEGFIGRVVKGSTEIIDEDFSAEGIFSDERLEAFLNGQITNPKPGRANQVKGAGSAFYETDIFKALNKVSNDIELDNAIIPQVVKWKEVLNSDKFKKLTGGEQSQMYQEFKRRTKGAIDKVREKPDTEKNATRVRLLGSDLDTKHLLTLNSDIMQAALSSPKHLFAQSFPSFITGLSRAFFSFNPKAVLKATSAMFNTSDQTLKEKIPSLFARKHLLDAVGEILGKERRKAGKRKITYFLHKGDYLGSKFQTLLEYYLENPNADLDSKFDETAMANSMITQAVTQGSNTLATAATAYRNPATWQKFILPFTMMNFNMSRQLIENINPITMNKSRYRKAVFAYSLGNVIVFKAIVDLYAEALDEAADFILGENEEDEEAFIWKKFAKKLAFESVYEATSLQQVPGIGDATDALAQYGIEYWLGDDYNSKNDRINYPGSNAKVLGLLGSQSGQMYTALKHLKEAIESKDEDALNFAITEMSQTGMTFGSKLLGGTSMGASYGVILEAIKMTKKSMKGDFEKAISDHSRSEKKKEKDPNLKKYNKYGKQKDDPNTRKYRIYN